MVTPTQRFFQAILPAEGTFITAYMLDGRLKQKVHNTQQGVIDFCESNKTPTTDCWFAVASYKQGWHTVSTAKGDKIRLRTQDNAAFAKSLWLDIDVGDGKDYATREDAIRSLVEFIKELGLHRPWVIASGASGVHVYFALDNAISKEDWQYLADRLKVACVAKGFRVDPSRTADIASLLRCPLTWNMKKVAHGGEAHQVHVIVEGKSASYDAVKQALEPFTHLLVKPNNAKAQQDDYPLRDANDLIVGCEQVRLQDGASEPVWRGMLATIRHCENGREVAHALSSKDPRYNAGETDEKLDCLEDNNIPPYTCKTFGELRPEVCQRCIHNEMINSPMSLPRLRPIPTVQIDDATSPTGDGQGQMQEWSKEAPQQEQTVYLDFTEIKTQNSKVIATGCWVRVKDAEGEWVWRNIYPYPVYPLQRIRGRTNKGETSISYILRKYRHNGYDDIQIAGSTLMGQNLNATLGDYGFLLTEKERKLMAGLLIDILKETEHTIGEVQTTDRLGWNDTYDTFLLGNKFYKTDGKVFEVAVAGKAKPFSDLTVPQGTLDTWKKIANVYNKEGLEWGQAVMSTAFASPLMPLGALEKSALLFITGDKGVGKSTALLLASSVYGNPERLMFNKMDTANSRFHKLGIYSNITASFDEMTDMSPKEASDFAYMLTQGRGKDRMGSGGEDMLLNTTYWSCLPVMSANDSMINALSQHSVDPTAQMSRVLEVKATDINKYYTAEEVRANEQLVRQLPTNFGTAGDAYIRYITTHKAEVLSLIHQTEALFKKYSKLNSNYRFWSYMCTRMIVGVILANKIGLLSYDVTKFFAYLLKVVAKAKAEVEKHQWTPENAIPTFLTANIPHRIVVTHERRPDGMMDNESRGALNDVNYVVQAPVHGRELTMRVELDTGNCIISRHAIKEWCKKAKMPVSEFMNLLEKQFVIVSNRARRDLGKQTVYRGGGGMECIIVNMPHHLFNAEEAVPI